MPVPLFASGVAASHHRTRQGERRDDSASSIESNEAFETCEAGTRLDALARAA